MAATVESALVLIDRASGPIRGIRRELRELQADAERTGKSLDALSGPRQARQMDQLARETRTLGTETHTAGDEIDRAETKMRRLEGRTDSLTGKTKKLHVEWSAFGKTIGLLKIPALVAGVGAATQVVGGLTAGVVALLPKLLDLGGLAAAGGTLMVGMGAGLGVAKLASLGLSKALQGNKAALKGLTPEGRAFVQVLKSMKPELDRLQATAQRGLLPGVTNLLGSLKSQAPQLRGIVGQQSKDLGGLATFLSKQVSNPQFMRDLASLSDQSARALGAGARSGFYFAQAIEQVLLAAAPFTDWLGSSIERFAKMADSEAQAAKESGRLGDFFGRAENAVKRLWDTGEHAFGALRGIMRAARGDSDSLWMSIDKGTKHWDWWANSVTGQTTMQRWFAQMRPVLSATLTLVGDIGKAIGSLTQGPEAAQMLHALDQAMPSIAGGLKSLTENLGPAVVSAFGSFVHLLSDAAGQSGPLTLLARAVGAVASDVDHLMNALGPVGHALGTAFLSFSLLKRLKAFDALDTLRAKWIGVGTAAADATVLERAAALAGETSGGVVPFAGGSGAGTHGTMGVPLVAGEGAAGVALAEEAAVGGAAGLGLSRGVAGLGEFSPGITAGVSPFAAGGALGAAPIEAAAAEGGGAGLLASTIGGAGEAGALRGGLGLAGKFILPLAGISGILGAVGTPGGIAAKAQGGLSAATLGLVPAPVSLQQKQSAGAAYAGTQINKLNNGSSITQQTKTIDKLKRQILRLPGTDAFDNNTADLATARLAMTRELHRREEILKSTLKAQGQSLQEQSVKNAQALSGDFAKAFEIRAKHDGPESAMEKTVQAVLKKMRGMSPAGAKVLDENVLAWAKQQAKSNPHLLTQVGKLESGIKDSFSRTGQHVQLVNGTILTGSTKEWSAIKAALTTQTEQAREQVSSDFTQIQVAAIGSLTAMGFSKSQATALVRSSDGQGAPQIKTPGSSVGAHANTSRNAAGGILPQIAAMGAKHATGGRLPGSGLQDTVPMGDGGWGAPGELVVNRHTERDIDGMLGMFGTRMSRMVANETRPHSHPFDNDPILPDKDLRRAKGGRLAGTGTRANYTAMLNRAEQIDSRHYPYLWGGGHDANFTPPYDCSGAWSDLLHVGGYLGSPMTSGEMMGIGLPGEGDVTLYANAGHVYGRLGNRWWGTSSANPAGGAGFFPGAPRPGFTVRHIPLGGAAGAEGMGGLSGDSSGLMAISALHSPASGIGGLPGLSADTAGNMYAAGLTKKINQNLAGMGGGGMGGGSVAGLSGGTSGANQTLGRAMMIAAGWPASQWPALKALWTQESGWDANAVNSTSGAYGIPQSLGHGHPYALGDARSQIAWGLNYIRSRYGSPSAAEAHEQADNWYATGGRLGGPAWGGWNAKGGDFTVNRPTVFGAGENGPEHVSITPAGKAGHGSLFTIAKGAVQVNTTGDAARLERMIEARLEKFARALAEEIESGVEEDEKALIA